MASSGYMASSAAAGPEVTAGEDAAGGDAVPERAGGEDAPERARSHSRTRPRLWPLERPPRNRLERAQHISMGCDLVQDAVDHISKLNKILEVVVEMQNHFERKAASVIAETKELQDAVLRDAEQAREGGFSS